MELPSTQTAIIQSPNGSPQLASGVPLAPLKPGTVMVKTVAVALNPSDNKMGAAWPTPGALVGMDFSGTIAAIHPDTVTDLAVGDRVCGMVHGSSRGDPTNGAFAQYVRAKAAVLLRVPGHLSMQDAATLGVGIMTNAMALWDTQALGLPLLAGEAQGHTDGETRTPVLIYGGSTATGTVAIQLVRLLGMDPVVTCSPRNFDLVCSRGASRDAVFDYLDPGLVDAIRKRTGGRLKYTYDCIGDLDGTSTRYCYDALGRVGGRYVYLEKVPKEVLQRRHAVRAKLVMGYEAMGEDVPLPGKWESKGDPEKWALAVNCIGVLQGLLDRQLLKTHPIQEVGGGLEGVLAGLKMLGSGDVSGKKLVVTL